MKTRKNQRYSASQKPKVSVKTKKKTKCRHDFAGSCKGSALYGLGFIGALIYYISISTGFWTGLFGVLKAIVWPAFLVYHLLKFLGM